MASQDERGGGGEKTSKWREITAEDRQRMIEEIDAEALEVGRQMIKESKPLLDRLAKS